MIYVPVKSSQPLSRDSIISLNDNIAKPLTKDTILSLNRQQNGFENCTKNECFQSCSRDNVQKNIQSQTTISSPMLWKIPSLLYPVKKGQRVQLTDEKQKMSEIRICFGWNINDTRCDVDASAFMLNASGKVLGDDWFIFYGQNTSPDQSIILTEDNKRNDRKVFLLNIEKVQCNITKIVFVLTINEALEKGLNFSMLRDVYIRIINSEGKELVSFKIEECLQNVTSLTAGELYLHNGQWKFNPVGNGVHLDLAGQCAVYGVHIN